MNTLACCMLSLTFNSHFRPHFPCMWKIQGKVSYWLYSILIPNASNMLSGGLLFCSWPLFLHSAEAPEKEGDGCCQGDLHLIFFQMRQAEFHRERADTLSRSTAENKAKQQLKTRLHIFQGFSDSFTYKPGPLLGTQIPALQDSTI